MAGATLRRFEKNKSQKTGPKRPVAMKKGFGAMGAFSVGVFI